ncbi:MAG: hypothetical protein ABSG25_02830 [Bryobacteraceae bacterium]
MTTKTILATAAVLMTLALSGCWCGHVPDTSPEVERQLRAEILAKHLAILELNSSAGTKIIQVDGQSSEWIPAPWMDWSVGEAIGTTDNGRGVLYWQERSDGVTEIVTVDRHGRKVRTIKRPCGSRTLSQDLHHVACYGPCECDGCGGMSCFSMDKLIKPIGSIDWSPDASQLVYATNDKIFVYDLRSDRSTALADGADVSWSPDGSWIAYRQDRDIKLISPTGRQVRTLVRDAYHDQTTAPVKWSPDSAYVLTGLTSYKFPISDGWWASQRVEVIRVSDGAELTLLYPWATGISLIEWIRLE